MFKKTVVILVAVGVVGTTVLLLAGFQLRNPFLDGEREKVSRGDMVIPVTASGLIQPDEFITIKSKAGGIVARIPVEPGDTVKAGTVLLELDPVDEKRNVEAREADLRRTASALEKARIQLENMRLDLPLQTKQAKARLDDAVARRDDAKFNWERIQELRQSADVAKVELWARESAYKSAEAQVALLEAEYKRAENNEDILIRSAQEDVNQAEAAQVAAQKLLDEARLRLSETTVLAPKDAMVYSIMVKEREAIQSGVQSFTGGTPLMILANVSAMFVVAQVDEADIGAIRLIAPDYAKPGKTRRPEKEEYERIAREAVEQLERGAATRAASEDEEAAQERAAEVLKEASSRMMNRPVEVTVEAYQRDIYHGVIERIEPEPQTINNVLTFKVRIRLVGGRELEKLLALQADLAFTTQKLSNVLRVKNEALFSEGKDCFVYVPMRTSPRGPWDEEKKPVKIGATDGTYTEIVSGLNEGDEVWVKRPKKTEKEKEQSSEA